MAQGVNPVSIGILGPGGVGGLISCLLWRSGHQLTVIGRENAAFRINENGIWLESPVYGNFTAKPRAVTSPIEEVDFLLITVKSPALGDALVQAKGCIGPGTVLVTLLNGLGHKEVIRELYPNPVFVGTIGLVEVFLGDDREIIHKSSGFPQIELGVEGECWFENASRIAKILVDAGLPTTVGTSECQVVWKKLVRLSALATLTSYFKCPLGDIRSSPTRWEMMREAVLELCEVAQVQGVRFDPDKIMEQISGFPDRLTTSMQRDIIGGRPSEVEAILGEPLRIGKRANLPLPCLDKCYRELTRV